MALQLKDWLLSERQVRMRLGIGKSCTFKRLQRGLGLFPLKGTGKYALADVERVIAENFGSLAPRERIEKR